MKVYKIGDVVAWRGAGKVSRLDGVAGKIVRGTVVEVHADSVTVEGHYPSLVPLHRVFLCDILVNGSPKKGRTR